MLTETGKSIIDDFINEFGKKGLFPNPCIGNEHAEWRLLVENVFMPLNEKIEKIILEKGYLSVKKKPSVDKTMEDCFIDFFIHNAQYKVIIKQWEFNDFSKYMPEKKYPPYLLGYIRSNYQELIKKQAYIRNKYIIKDKKTKNKNKDYKEEQKPYHITNESIIIDYLKKAIKYNEKKEYHNALYLLYRCKNHVQYFNESTSMNKYRFQLWEYFDKVVFDFQQNDQKLFYEELEKKNITGMINYNINYSQSTVEPGIFLENASEEPQYFLFDDPSNPKQINYSFCLYEEVEILSYNYVYKKGNDSHSLLAPPLCQIRTQDCTEGWIEGKFLWFFPSYAKNTE
jgi:hypothetical protein